MIKIKLLISYLLATCLPIIMIFASSSWSVTIGVIVNAIVIITGMCYMWYWANIEFDRALLDAIFHDKT